MKLNPYLGFDGRAEEAMKFYQTVFGGELSVMLVSDTPMCDSMPPGMQGHVMHSALTTPDWVLMGTDMRGPTDDAGVSSVASDWDSLDELKAAFERLKDGGTVTVEPAPAFWGGTFGCVKDRYGVNWMMTCDAG